MVPQHVKDALFAVNRLAVGPNNLLWRARFKLGGKRDLYVNLGCGPHRVEGMINCDGNLFNKIDLWLDLRRRLPFPDASVAVAYCSHTLEHLFPEDALRLLREIRRILQPDGIARIVVPDVSYAFRIASGAATSPWPRSFTDPVGQAMNYLFCDGQHKYAYSYGMLAEFATQVGFENIVNVSDEHGVAPRPYGSVMLGNEAEGSLVVELRR